ncbi:MAG: hypothetical protein ABJ004_02455 [Cyclobacteriaceae bacterium]
MNFGEAQKDMRDAYLSGSSGVLISSLVWLTAGIFAIFTTKQTSFIVFFIGGMFIHPIGILIAKFLNRSGKHLKGNSLGILAMGSTVIVFIGLFLGYSFFQTRPNWLFPIMLITIGVRYLIFQTIYGMKIYWILGLILIASGLLGLYSNQPFYTFGIIGGMIEFLFSILIFRIDKKTFKLRSEHKV